MIPELTSRLLVFSLHETIMILFVFYYHQYLSKQTKFIIAIKTNTRVSLAQLQFTAELLSFRVIWDKMLIIALEKPPRAKLSLNAILFSIFRSRNWRSFRIRLQKASGTMIQMTSEYFSVVRKVADDEMILLDFRLDSETNFLPV